MGINPTGSPGSDLRTSLSDASMTEVSFDDEERSSENFIESKDFLESNDPGQSVCWTVLCAPFRFVIWLFRLCCCWCRKEAEERVDDRMQDDSLKESMSTLSERKMIKPSATTTETSILRLMRRQQAISACSSD